MKLYMGGAWQGKCRLVMKSENISEDEIVGPEDLPDGKKALAAYHLRIQKQLKQGMDPVRELERLYEQLPDIILICDEVGAGVIPMEKEKEQYREAVGRCLCRAAELADEVYRVVCGIGIRIK